MGLKTLIALLIVAGIAFATDVPCVPFSGTSSISSGSVVVDIYTDYLCTASVFTGGFTYAGKSWQVTLGNCTSASSLNLTEFETYYYKYLINGLATSDGSCHSFIATNPTNGTTTINNFVSGANITNLNLTNNITYNYSTVYNITNNITGSSNWTDLFNFPPACGAGEAVTQINSTLTCSPFIVIEVDPVWTAEKVNYTTTLQLPKYNNLSWGDIIGMQNLTYYTLTADLPVYNNLSYDQIAQSFGNWSGNITSYWTSAQTATLGNWSANQSNYYNKSEVEALDNLTNYYNKTTSDGRYIRNGTDANLSALTITGSNLDVTIGNITYVDRNGKTRVVQDTTQGYDELTTNTLLDKSRSTLTCGGSQLNYTLIALNGGGEWNFDGTFYGGAGVSVPNGTVTLLNGTNTTPKTNYVHFYLNSNVPTLTTTEAYPSYTHIDVATFVIGETVGANCVVYSYSRNRYETDTFITRVLERFEETGTLYISGFTPTATTKTIQIGTGNFFNGIFEMFTNVSRNSTTNGFYLINSTGNFLQKATTDANTFSQYATGEAVSNNRYVNVIWGIVPTTTTGGGTSATVPRLVAVLQSKPATEYNSIALAEQDTYGMTNFYPPNSEVKNVFTPVARTVIRYESGGGGTGTLQTLSNGQLFRDIRGAVTSSGASATPGTSDHATLTNLGWSAAGHTMDTTLDMNANSIIGVTTMNATTYVNLPVYNNGTSNLTLAQVATDIANSTIIRSGNTSWIQANQLTYQNGSSNLTYALIATNIINSTIVHTGSANCTAGNVVQNVTLTTTGVTTQCVAATAAAGGGNVTASNGTNLYYARFTNATNIAQANIYENATCVIIAGSTSTFKIC